jgi:mRNA interferase HigB
VRIIARSTLRDFYSIPQYQDSKKQLDAWWYEAKNAVWKTPTDVKAKYGNSSPIANNRVVFNICGNKYRLIVEFHYDKGRGYIRFVGTHQDYDAIDAETI